MDGIVRRLVALLDEAVPEPAHEIAIADVDALTRPRLATVQGRVRRAARRRTSNATGSRRRRLAVLAAAATAVAVAAVSVLLSRNDDRDHRDQPSVTSPAQLTSTAWELTKIARPGHSVEPASAPVYFSFAEGGSTDHAGDAGVTHISPGRITFGPWANDLLFHKVPRLTIVQNNAVFGLMADDTLTWSITGDTLTFDRPGAGTLTFRRFDYDAHPPVYGSVSGRFMAAGGPAPGLPRPMPGFGSVTLTAESGRVQTVDAAGGRYGTAIAPGSYTVYGHISSYQGGRLGCAAHGFVIVRANKSAHIDIYCEER
jgi:hypothetical protein